MKIHTNINFLLKCVGREKVEERERERERERRWGREEDSTLYLIVSSTLFLAFSDH